MPRSPIIADQAYYEIGQHARIDEGVLLGYRYPGDSRPLRIGDYAIIRSGSLVNKDVPPDTLAYGVPARHHPLPEALSRGNLPELLLPQTDLWGAQRDNSWKDETRDAFPRR